MGAAKAIREFTWADLQKNRLNLMHQLGVVRVTCANSAVQSCGVENAGYVGAHQSADHEGSEGKVGCSYRRWRYLKLSKEKTQFGWFKKRPESAEPMKAYSLTPH